MTERLSVHTRDSLGLSNVRVITAKFVLGLFLIFNISLKSQSLRLEKKKPVDFYEIYLSLILKYHGIS